MAKLTPEDKVAQQLVNAVNMISLDLDQVGKNIAWTGTNLSLNRLEVILESAQEERGELYVRYNTIRD